MTANFLKITFRGLWKNRGYSFLNIFGLAIGIACAGLIFLWVEDELGYDTWLAKRDRLYYIEENQVYEGKTRTLMSTPAPMAPAIRQEIPGIAAVSRVVRKQVLFNLGDKGIYEWGGYVDPTLFQMLGLSFVEGSATDAFRDVNDIVLTQTVAHQFFGDAPALGKTIKLDQVQEWRVSGVVRDLPENSTIKLSWLAPFSTYYSTNRVVKNLDSWGRNSLSTYVELMPGTDAATVNRKLAHFLQSKDKNIGTECFLYSAMDWHLRDHFEDGRIAGGRIDYVQLFVVIAWIILLIACINFMNLSTARSAKRAREVGVRKVLGAERRGLIARFMGEGLVMAALAVSLGVVLIALAMPAFDLLVGRPLQMRLLTPTHLGALAALALVCGLVAGSYPAFYLSSFKPILVFKGLRVKGASAAVVRKGLVVLQFTTSVVLIIATVIIYRQVEHIRNRDLGYDRRELVTIPVRGDLAKHFGVIRQDLLRTGVVANAALNSYNTFSVGENGSDVQWAGKNPADDILFSYRSVSPAFLTTMGMRLKEGRDFRQDRPDVDSSDVLVTETMATLMGKGSVVGRQIYHSNHPYTIVGVVRDFVYGDMYGKPDPVIFFNDSTDTRLLYVRLKAGVQEEDALAKMEAVLKQDNPGYPFDYSFVDDDFNALFRSEQLIGQLSRLFAVLAIVISCLGLFGLSAYMAERRVKEIGIRKVLGASVSSLSALLSREFLQLVGLSTLIAFPLAWMIMGHWLRQYAYRIDIEWWVFLAAGAAALLIALATVSIQSVRAAMMNPARSLRTE